MRFEKMRKGELGIRERLHNHARRFIDLGTDKNPGIKQNIPALFAATPGIKNVCMYYMIVVVE
jgi:hypothetical protein